MRHGVGLYFSRSLSFLIQGYCLCFSDPMTTTFCFGGQEKDDMLREILSEFAGEFLCMDGTFRIAGRVMDSMECLFFLLGEDAKVHAWAAVRSESKEEIRGLLLRYMNAYAFGSCWNCRVMSRSLGMKTSVG